MKFKVCVFILVAFSSCESFEERKANTGSEAEEMMLVESISEDDERSQKSSNSFVDQNVSKLDERKLIKTGSLSFKTEDIENTKIEIEKICRALNGYIANEHGGSDGERLYYEQNIRIPAADFERFIQAIEKLAPSFENKNIVSQDVTEEFVDIEARLKTKKELERRYLELLQVAKTVEDMLAIETQIGNVRAEIESVEGRLNVIKNKISFSTLTISYYELTGVDFGFASKFVHSFKNGWENLLSFFIAMINAWPFLILSGLVFYLISKKYKRFIFSRPQA
jgi:hypothetical protein